MKLVGWVFYDHPLEAQAWPVYQAKDGRVVVWHQEFDGEDGLRSPEGGWGLDYTSLQELLARIEEVNSSMEDYRHEFVPVSQE